ncbi:MAG: MBL fold metallo-hydrolase [Clostridia bacterium]|nr:MBL fold metallo-hydrolase [Clostridia bacterium]
MMARQQFSKAKNIFTSILCLILGLVAGFVFFVYSTLPGSYSIPSKINGSSTPAVADGIDVDEIKSEDLSIHFIELGNKYTGDCVLIKTGNTEILVDAGSKASSINTIESYIDTYCTDNVLEYIIITHAHEDHYAGFVTPANTESLFDYYSKDGRSIETVVTFAQTHKTTANAMFKNFDRELTEVKSTGTNVFTALNCWNNEIVNGVASQRTYSLENGISLEFLYQKFYEESNKDETSTENNFSVCFQIVQGTKKYLFTGDLEKDGEQSLVEENSLGPVELYKAGHHGSKTSSSEALLNVIQPKIVCVCCCAGSSEYTKKNENQFPTQEFVDRVSIYTKQIFVTTLCIDYNAGTFTSFNGNIVVHSSGTNNSTVSCSNNTTILKETDWFKQNRTLPENAIA